MKFFFKMILAIFFSLFLLLWDVNPVPAASSYEPLHAAMSAAGAKAQEWSIHSWAKLPDSQVTDEQLKNLVEEAMAELGMNAAEYQLTHQHENQYQTIRAEVIRPKLHAVILVQVLTPRSQPGLSEAYFVINIEGKEDGNISIKEMQEKITGITKKNGHSAQINTCLIGWLDGKLRDGEWRDFLQNAFAVIHARNIDKLETEHFVSYTGFTPKIAERLQIGGKTINVNIAMHYNQYDQRTYVTIGSPIITREY